MGPRLCATACRAALTDLAERRGLLGATLSQEASWSRSCIARTIPGSPTSSGIAWFWGQRGSDCQEQNLRNRVSCSAVGSGAVGSV
eukprot:scaffold3100_cov248-Pinguiococcus_pyrenoidosus.AAC.6